MVIDSKFGASITSIKELLESSERFVVPKFQRNYSWDDEKVEELWGDLVENYETITNKIVPNEEAQYLLGPMVLLKSDKSSEFYVIDGQQRLATLTMLFCVARDIILEDAKLLGSDRHEVEKLEGIVNNLIQVTELGEHRGWKLVLNDTDRDLFETVQKFEEGEDISQLERLNKKFKSRSLTNIKRNYECLHHEISYAVATNFSKDPALRERVRKMDKDTLREMRLENINSLIKFVLFVAEYNFVIKVILKEDSTAFQVFETLNYRGLTLAKSNLIKNHVLNKVGSDNKALQDNLSFKWNRIFDELIGQDQKDDVFVMESLRSRRSNPKKESISKKNIYKVIKKKIPDENPQVCKEFVNDLEEDASFLAKLNDPTQYDDLTTKDEVDAIKILNAQSVRFPILTAYRKWCSGGKYEERYRELVRILVKFFFKYRTVRRKHPGDIETIMGEVSSMIHNGATSIRDMRTMDGKNISILDILKRNDDHEHFKLEFENEFVVRPVKKSAKYVLQQITLKLGTKYDDVKPIDGLTLEHILPRNYSKSWNREEFFSDSRYTTEQDMGRFVHRLGNMTLLKDAINSKLRDSTFRDKKHSIDKETGDHDGYLASKLAINQNTVCNVETWSSFVIEDREKYFAKLADDIWSLDL